MVGAHGIFGLGAMRIGKTCADGFNPEVVAMSSASDESGVRSLLRSRRRDFPSWLVSMVFTWRHEMKEALYVAGAICSVCGVVYYLLRGRRVLRILRCLHSLVYGALDRKGLFRNRARYKVVCRFPQPPDHVVFAYGSLLVRRSILRTVSEQDVSRECIPATLSRYRLCWSPAYPNRSMVILNRDLNSTAVGFCSLTVEYTGSPSDYVPGALIGVTHRAYLALCNREVHYELLDVSTDVQLSFPARRPREPVYAFVPQPNARDSTSQADFAVVREDYLNPIRNALRHMGHRAPPPPPCPVRQAFTIDELVERTLHAPRSSRQALERVHFAVIDALESLEQDKPFRRFALRPLCFPRPLYEHIANTAEIALGLCVTSLQAIAGNEALLKAGGWDCDDARILLHGRQTDDLLPRFARVDLVMSGKRLLVLEVNCDSPGGVLHHDIVSEAQASILSKEAHLSWVDFTHKSVRSLVRDKLVEMARNSPAEHPFCTIIEKEPSKWPTYPEMLYFERALADQGLRSALVDLDTTQLSYQDAKLLIEGNNQPINLVYKRILWQHLKNVDTITARALFDAYLDNTVIVVNSLASRMAGSKFLLALMKSQGFSSLLESAGVHTLAAQQTSVINDCIPRTWVWGDVSRVLGSCESKRTEILENFQSYVWKGFHGFGGKRVIIGLELTATDNPMNDLWNQGYVVQEFLPHGRASVPIYDGDVEWRHLNYILGAYLVDGKFVGMEAKVGPGMKVNMNQNGYRTGVFPASECISPQQLTISERDRFRTFLV